MNSQFETVRLPVGIRRDGTVCRNVALDELCGADEENFSNPKFKGNSARAFTVLLQRTVQEIEGFDKLKDDQYHLAPMEIFRSMYQADRDALVVALRRISQGDEVITVWECSSCRRENEDPVLLSSLKMREWPDDQPTTIPFEIPRGLEIGGVVVKKGTLRLLRGIETEQISLQIAKDPASAGTAFLAALIAEFEGGLKPDSETLRRMRAADRNYLAELVQEKMPGIQTNTSLECANCGKLNEKVGVDVAGFFSPTSRR